jgi:hypothetical protein
LPLPRRAGQAERLGSELIESSPKQESRHAGTAKLARTDQARTGQHPGGNLSGDQGRKVDQLPPGP